MSDKRYYLSNFTKEQLAEMCAAEDARTDGRVHLVYVLQAENAKLREQIESLQPKDCEGNALDIADTVSMLRSEYDGDHEWDDVVTELVLTKWGGDRWIVRGSKGEAWACDCAKTGYDEDAYEASYDVEPFGEPTLLEAENAKLREEVEQWHRLTAGIELPEYPITEFKPKDLERENAKLRELGKQYELVIVDYRAEVAKLRKLLSIMTYCNQFRRDCDGCSLNGAAGIITERAGCDELLARLREMGVEVNG